VRLTINGKESTLEPGQTVAGWLAASGLDPQAVIVEINEAIVARELWPDTALTEGDRVEVVSFVGGG